MKIKCEYCGSMFDDTLEKCPNCGGTNNNVRRSTADQPTTIDELKEWYKSKGLPDEEVTRFFIGRDYKGSKAFGIYKAPDGNFVVYKNKADGSRAVRYEGTDEAYAVNELLTRLKQEILEQKARTVNKSAAEKSAVSPSELKATLPQKEQAPALSPEETQKIKKGLKTAGIALVAVVIAIIGITAAVKIHRKNSIPYIGYYKHNGELYYHCEDSLYYWAKYNRETNDWEIFDYIGDIDEELHYRKSAKQYFLGEDYDSSYGGSDIQNSLEYKDYLNAYWVDTGYYDYEDTVYYHNGLRQDSDWYYFDTDDNDWMAVPDDMLPDALTHESIADDFWYTPKWDSETQLTDFEDTAIYRESLEQYETSEDKDESWWGTDSDSSSDDYDWDWGSNSWDSGSTDWNSNW